jgi:hypothetical protein
VSKSVEIAGVPKDLEFPPMCANCGNATSESLDVAKVFRRVSDDGPDSFALERAMVPFCPPCIMQHDNEVRKVSPSERLWMTCRGREALGVPAFAVLGLLMLYAEGRRPHPIFLGLAALFGCLAWYSYRTAYRDSERFAIPPLTSVTSAFDFTDTRARLFEREHRTLILRNDTFADSLIARNPTRLWTADDQAKSQAGWRRFFR